MDLNDASSHPAAPQVDVALINLDDVQQREFPLPGQRIDGFQVVMRQSVINDIRNHGQSNADIEICGVVVGKLYRDERGPFLYVEGSIRGRFADGKIAQVTFTSDTWDHIHQELDVHFPELRIAGWYHTHPDFGIFLSEMDKFIHGNFFAVPWQIAYVYDPIRGKDGAFLWKSGEPVDSPFLIEPDVDPCEAKFSAVSVKLKSGPAPQTAGAGPDVGATADVMEVKQRIAALERNQFLSTLLMFLIVAAQLGLLGWLHYVNPHLLRPHDPLPQSAPQPNTAVPEKNVSSQESQHAK
jgi:proteasome lid subunit RPN8/RPN11